MATKNKHFETERAYLVSLGLAKPGRGRFSKEGKEALAKARESGVTFGAPADGGDASGNSKPLAVSAARGSSSSENVRSWARANGFKVGERGRISAEILAAYNGEDLEPEKHDGFSLARPIVPQPRIRQIAGMYGLTEEGWKVGFSLCRRCVAHVSRCACPDGPQPPSIVVKLLPLTDPLPVE